MTDEIEIYPNRTIVLPFSGEVISLDDPDEVGARLAEARRLRNLIAEAERLLVAAINEYAEITAQPRTVVLPNGQTWIREGGPSVEYDAAAVERELRDAGMPDEALRRIVKRTTTVKVDGTEANKAKRANPAYAEILDRHSTKVEKPFRVNPK